MECKISKPADCHCSSYHGIATHYIHSSSLPDLESRLAELTIPDYASLEDRYKIINNTIAEFISSLPHNEPLQIGGDRRKAVDRCFAPQQIEDILKLLEDEANSSSTQAGWAQKTLEAINGRSPTSLKVTLHQMGLGSRQGEKNWGIMEAFEQEHQIAARFMNHPDFVEGVSARLLRRPPETPKWQPAELSEVAQQDVDSFFQPTEQSPSKLQMLKQGSPAKLNYKDYPHSWTALPKERDIKQYIDQCVKNKESVTRDTVQQHFLTLTNGKPGVQEVLDDILQRQTKQEGEQLRWQLSSQAGQQG